MKSEIKHPFPPLFDEDSKVLILGSFPSVKSREENFFYGHPQNRFWKITSAVLNEDIPDTVDKKKSLLLKHRIALWDSIAQCEIKGSSDASIEKVVPNNLSPIFQGAKIEAVFCNGKKAHELYKKHIEPFTGREAICLPSTSPANASWSLERLIDEYRSALTPYI